MRVISVGLYIIKSVRCIEKENYPKTLYIYIYKFDKLCNVRLCIYLQFLIIFQDFSSSRASLVSVRCAQPCVSYMYAPEVKNDI